MNRLDDNHIHLLLDEPIYVLADHGDHPSDEAINDNQPGYIGENGKGICIFAEAASEEDLAFLFKGLNALNINKQDIALFEKDYDSLQEYPIHQRRLRFSEHVDIAKAFKVIHADELTTLSTIPLEEIRNNQDFKRQFWEALKVIFKAL
jgi:hypothetical protein